MKRDTINYVVVGAFVISLFCIFLLVLYRITGSTGATDDYYVVYENVAGIKYGTPVLYEGFQIGQVENIDPQFTGGDTRYRLTLSVKQGWRIQQDSIARIEASGLLSTVSIDIKKGKSGVILAPGGEIRGKPSNDLFSTVNGVAEEIRDLAHNSLRPLLDKLNKQVDLIGGDIRDITTGEIKPLFRDQVFPLMKKLNTSADRLSRVLSDTNLDNVDSTLANLQAATTEADTLMRNLQLSRQAIDELLAKAGAVVDDNSADLKSSVTDLKKTLYVTSQHIDAIAHHLESASRNMQEFSRQIRENPSLLLRGTPPSDWKGRQ
jgi:phospholipid/cholesterol/gamma-HCH transport system substrate-binding protein